MIGGEHHQGSSLSPRSPAESLQQGRDIDVEENHDPEKNELASSAMNQRPRVSSSFDNSPTGLPRTVWRYAPSAGKKDEDRRTVMSDPAREEQDGICPRDVGRVEHERVAVDEVARVIERHE